MPILLLVFLNTAFAQEVPPPLPTLQQQVLSYHYNGPTGQGVYTPQEIGVLIAKDRNAEHLLWTAGWDSWKSWDQVQQIVVLVPPPPPVAVKKTFQYHSNGQSLDLTAQEIAQRVSADPDAAHLVWQNGMTSWTSAKDVEEIAKLISSPPVVPPPEKPLVMPLEKPVIAVPKSDESYIKLGGETWFLGGTNNLSSLSDPEVPANLGFSVKRLRFLSKAKLNKNISAQIHMDFPQDGSSTVYKIDFSSVDDRLKALEGRDDQEGTAQLDAKVNDYAEGWASVAKATFVDFSYGEKVPQRIRVGIQKPIFATRDSFEKFNQFFLGGDNAYKTMAWRYGVMSGCDLGVAYKIGPEKFSVEGQVLNGSGVKIDESSGKEIAGRAKLNVSGISAQVSGQYEIRGVDNMESVAMVDASVGYEISGFRVMAEGLTGTAIEEQTEFSFAGVQLAAAYDLPIKKVEIIDHLNIVGRYMYFDPFIDKSVSTPYPDASWVTSLGAQVYYKTNKGSTLLTGLVFENVVPQNEEEAVVNSLVAQTVWKF